jgi:hypothetical protein
MAIPWLTLLKTVPWTDVIANAPTIANGAKKLWHSVSGRSPHLEVPAPDMGAGSSAEGEDLAKVQAELRGLRITIILKTSVERVRRPDQAGVWREATTPQGRSLQGGATKPDACLGRKAGA